VKDGSSSPEKLTGKVIENASTTVAAQDVNVVVASGDVGVVGDAEDVEENTMDTVSSSAKAPRGGSMWKEQRWRRVARPTSQE
jgi:primase-polymerase (primpol)-like protein